MSYFLHQRSLHNILSNPNPTSPNDSPTDPTKSTSIFSKTTLLLLLSLLVILGVIAPWIGTPQSLFTASPSSSQSSLSKWRDYTLPEAAARSGTIIVCAVSQPYLPFFNNWLISIARQKRHEQVLVIAEDYATLYEVNGKWPGHAMLVLPAPDAQTAHKFGSQVLLGSVVSCIFLVKIGLVYSLLIEFSRM